MNKLIRKIMNFINRHQHLWDFFIQFEWYRKELRRQSKLILRGK